MEQTYKPKTKLWNETSVEAAVKEVFEDKKALYKIALEYISFSTQQRQCICLNISYSS